MSILESDQLGFGISALDIQSRDISKPDELLVDERTGQMFYKRKNDGIIIWPYPNYTKETLLADLTTVGPLSNVYTDYVVYNTISIIGKNDISSNEIFPLSLGVNFFVSKNENKFLVRIRGTEAINAISAYVTALRDEEAPDEEIPDVELHYIVTYSDDVSISQSMYLSFNQLTALQLTRDYDATIEIIGIEFPRLSRALTEIDPVVLEKLKKLNYDNEVFVASCIDFISFTDEVEKIPIINDDETVRFMMTIPMSQYKDFYNDHVDTTVTLSSIKPDYDSLWAMPVNPA